MFIDQNKHDKILKSKQKVTKVPVSNQGGVFWFGHLDTLLEPNLWKSHLLIIEKDVLFFKFTSVFTDKVQLVFTKI